MANAIQQFAQYSELQNFITQFAPYANGRNFSVVSINGGRNDQGLDVGQGEANLDIQYAMAMSHRVPIRYYSTGGQGPLKADLE